MQQKIIIAFITIFFILSSAYLFNVSEKKQDPGLNKNWWIAYFENPTDNSLDFTIENYSSSKDFSWEAISKDTDSTIESGKETIVSGQTKKINFATDVQKEDLITIHITTDQQETKEIYKNIN